MAKGKVGKCDCGCSCCMKLVGLLFLIGGLCLAIAEFNIIPMLYAEVIGGAAIAIVGLITLFKSFGSSCCCG